MSEPKPPYDLNENLKRCQAVVDRIQRATAPEIVLNLFGVMLRQVVDLAAEVERGRAAREQWGEENAELARIVAENAMLTRDVEFHKSVARDKHREIESLNKQKASANARHERELVQVLRELEAVKTAKSAADDDRNKAWHQLTALEDERDQLRKLSERQAVSIKNWTDEVDKLRKQVDNLTLDLETQKQANNRHAQTITAQAKKIENLKESLISFKPTTMRRVDVSNLVCDDCHAEWLPVCPECEGKDINGIYFPKA